MPDIVTHNAMGDKVLCRLPLRILAEIDHDIFHFSVMGPDPFIFYRFFLPHFRHGVNKRSHKMHRTNCNRFLMELLNRSNTREMFSFLAGFLCHFALDSISHPYIYGTANYQADMHTAIEHKLDVLELERQGKQRRDIMKLFTAFPDLQEVRQAMETVYGWNDDYYKIGHRHMKLYHWIVKDQTGVVNLFLHRFPGNLSAISYRNHKCDDMDLSPFDVLEEQAVEFGVNLITAAYQYQHGEIDNDTMLRLIGDKSYAGAAYEE